MKHPFLFTFVSVSYVTTRRLFLLTFYILLCLFMFLPLDANLIREGLAELYNLFSDLSLKLSEDLVSFGIFSPNGEFSSEFINKGMYNIIKLGRKSIYLIYKSHLGKYCKKTP